MAQRLRAALMEAELFSSSRLHQLENGTSKLFILFAVNPMGVFLMAHCSACQVSSMEPRITAAKMALAVFTNYRPGKAASGASELFIVFKMEATAIVLSAILFATTLAIFLGLPAKADRVVVQFSN